MPRCSVVMPTYQNELVIAQSLMALFSQPVPSGWQVRLVVADDGSTDQTVAAVHALERESPWPLLVLPGAHAGVAATRNRALRDVPDEDVVLFLGADQLLRPGAVAVHLCCHNDYPDQWVGGLGFIQWDPRLESSALMEWMVHGGQQNNFDALLGSAWADSHHFFYGSFISVKRSILGVAPFRESFDQYGWEDLELGRRLAAAGLRLRCLPEALALHHHPYSPVAIERRQYLIGQGLLAYQQLYPDVPLLPARPWWHRSAVWLWRWLGGELVVRLLVHWGAERFSWPQLFHLYTVAPFWRGVYSRK